jgi:hypothetical protein
LANGEACQTNLLGTLIEAGYDVLSDVRLINRFTCDLMVRVADGFVVIEIIINPKELDIVKNRVNMLWDVLGQYKDLQAGYFIALLDSNNDIPLDKRAKHVCKDDKISWWGGRISRSHENAENDILQTWNISKLSLYRIRKEVHE